VGRKARIMPRPHPQPLSASFALRAPSPKEKGIGRLVFGKGRMVSGSIMVKG